MTSPAMTRLAARSRITREAVGFYLFDSIREELGRDVGILSVEEFIKGWETNRDFPGSHKSWRVEVADSGRVYSKRVSIGRRADGSIAHAKIS